MKRLLALCLVAFFAAALCLGGCKKKDAGNSSKDDEKDEVKIPAALQNVADDFCKASKYGEYMAGLEEFGARAAWNPGFGSIEDQLVSLKESAASAEFPWKDCETEKPDFIKCEKALERISEAHHDFRLNKMNAAFKEMGLSSDDCASMEVGVKTGESGRAKSYNVYLAKDKRDKWVVFGDDRTFELPMTKAQENMKQIAREFCDSRKLVDIAKDSMEFMARAYYDPATSMGKRLEDTIKELKDSINEEAVRMETCKSGDPRAVKCDEAFMMISQAANGYIKVDKMKVAAREMGLSETECAMFSVTGKQKSDTAEKTVNFYVAKNKGEKWIVIGTDERMSPAPAEAPAPAPAPAPDAAAPSP